MEKLLPSWLILTGRSGRFRTHSELYGPSRHRALQSFDEVVPWPGFAVAH